MNVDNISSKQEEAAFESFKRERVIYCEKNTSDDSFKRMSHKGLKLYHTSQPNTGQNFIQTTGLAVD